MVSEPDTGRCASKDAEPRREWIPNGVSTRTLGPEEGWTPSGVPMRTLGPKDRWIVRSHIDWREERNILYKGVKASP